MAQIKRLSLKLGTMRKAADFLVYPGTDDTRIMIQSDTRIAVVDAGTGRGILSRGVSSGAYGVHLSAAAGATVIQVAPDVVDAIKQARPQPGDSLGPGVIIGGVR